MGRRYSKNYSNYILKKKYQYTTKGTIWERDWVTIGAKHQIEKGKRPFFGDSGFLFTDNSFPSRQRRHDFGKVVAEWLYDDVKDATTLVNKVDVNYVSDDLRDFAYYGSCVELVRSSIFDIINWFPGCAWKTRQQVTWVSGNSTLSGYVVKNPFNIDFATEKIKEDEIANRMRFLSLSYKNYEVVCDHNFELRVHPILFYETKWRKKDEIDTDIAKEQEKDPKCDYIVQLAQVDLACVDENNNSFSITLYVLNASGEVIVASTGLFGGHDFVELRPTESVIDAYFNGLEGFEKLLLRTDTIPLYANKFLKMFETDNGIRYAYRDYIWPRVNDYCIDIESPTYIAFVEKLIETSTEFDDMWTDNMWRNMTHESIRNYDWTYTKTYIPGDEEPNIMGGNRMEKLIRIYGRVFDDIKRYIDGIKFTTKVSYDGQNNMPNAELSDRLDYNGWEIFSTIPNFKGQIIDDQEDDSDLSTVYIDYDKIAPNRWFNAVNPTEVTAGVNDIDFLRSLALSSKYILMSKGTTNGIDMVMALFGIGSDKEETDDITYKISERYYTTSLYDFSEKRQQTIGDLVHYDSAPSPYDEAYEGVPFGNVELYGKKYILPYYDSNKYYKGEFTFQSRGGWYKKSLDVDNLNDYEETLSYLNVVPNFESLFTVNTYSLEKVGENANIPPSNIYYVVDPRDYANYNEVSPYNITHYFYITDIYNPQLADSWMPILYEYVDVENLITPEEYDNLPYKLKATDLVWDAYSQPVVETEQDYGALDAFYLYICNNTVVRFIDKNTYESSENLGYSVIELCQTDDNYFHISKTTKHGDHAYWKLVGNEYDNKIVTPGKFIPNSFVLFYNEVDNDVTYDQWKTFTLEKKAQYELDYTLINEALNYGIRSTVQNAVVDGDVCDFNLEQLFYESRRLRQEDYVHLIDLYSNDRDNYVPITDLNDEGEEVIVGYARKYAGDTDLYERAKYLDSIISSNIGNNPHVGFGRYDLGNEYRAYMEYPFKYYEDNYVLPEDLAFSDYKYDINEYETVNKVKNISDTYHYENGYAKRIDQDAYDAITDEEEKERYERQIVEVDEDGNPIYEYVKNITSEEYEELPESEQSDYNKTTAKIIRRGTYRDPEDYYVNDEDEVVFNDTPIDYIDEEKLSAPTYYLNSKLIKIEFKNTNERFKKFFLDVIGKYMMQVMPSTAITVVLFDCDNKEEEPEG